jgi:hypothetical protein
MTVVFVASCFCVGSQVIESITPAGSMSPRRT